MKYYKVLNENEILRLPSKRKLAQCLNSSWMDGFNECLKLIEAKNEFQLVYEASNEA